MIRAGAGTGEASARASAQGTRHDVGQQLSPAGASGNPLSAAGMWDGTQVGSWEEAAFDRALTQTAKADLVPSKHCLGSQAPGSRLGAVPLGGVLHSQRPPPELEKGIRERGRAARERWPRSPRRVPGSPTGMVTVDAQKYTLGLRTFWRRKLFAVLIAKVQFDATPLFATQCFSYTVTNYNTEARIQPPKSCNPGKPTLPHPISSSRTIPEITDKRS